MTKKAAVGFGNALAKAKQAIPGIKVPGVVAGAKPIASNPFNMKVTKPKFDVLNRNLDRSARGSTVTSRTRAEAIRSATLLPEWKQLKKGHVAAFVDRRFGEKNKSLSREEKMQERFTREQQRRAKVQQRKKNRFDLNDDAGNYDSAGELALTHGGQSLSALNDEELEAYDALDPEEEEAAFGGNLGRRFVAESNFGVGGQPEEPGAKTKQDIMRELIAKSKFHKAERQRQKEADVAMTEDLDAQFAELRGCLVKADAVERRRQESHEDGDDDYEGVLKTLTFDPRSRPTDRTLTAEEAETRDVERREKDREAMLARMTEAASDNLPGSLGVDEVERSGLRRERSLPGSEDAQDPGTGSPVDPELLKQINHLNELVDVFCGAEELSVAQEAYEELVLAAKKSPRLMIHVGRQIRVLIGEFSAQFTERGNSTGRGDLMPALSSARLLLLVSRLFSCSDFHHVVATPAQLLLSYYLAVGRMVRVLHVQRALALVFVSLQFQQDGRRYVPEALEVLFTILSSGKKHSPSHYFCRPLGKTLALGFRDEGAEPLGEATLRFDRLFFEDLTVAQLRPFAQALAMQWLELLAAAGFPAWMEVASPFAELLQDPRLEELIEGCRQRKMLALQDHKPLALPMLTPDYAADYSMDASRHRSGSDATADDRASARLRAAHRREFKGAMRELRRDTAFLAEKQLHERRSEDSAYKQKINQIMGSIGNEGAGGKTGGRKK